MKITILKGEFGQNMGTPCISNKERAEKVFMVCGSLGPHRDPMNGIWTKSVSMGLSALPGALMDALLNT